MTNIPRDNNLFRVITGLETKKAYQGRRNLELTQDIEEASGGLTSADVDTIIDAHKFGAASSLQFTLNQFFNQNTYMAAAFRPSGHYMATPGPTVQTANTIIKMPIVVPYAAFMQGVRLRVGTASGFITVGLADSAGTMVVVSTPTTSVVGFQSISFTSFYLAKPGQYYIIIQVVSGALALYGVGTTNYMGACTVTANGGTIPAVGASASPVPGNAQTTSAFIPVCMTF